MHNSASSCQDIASCAQKNTTGNFTLFRAISAFLVSLTDSIFDRLDQQRTYQTLQAMDDRALDDIGMSRADVEALKDRRS
jgi:uncharacterized protein YjiS (DUF1127 family)